MKRLILFFLVIAVGLILSLRDMGTNQCPVSKAGFNFPVNELGLQMINSAGFFGFQVSDDLYADGEFVRLACNLWSAVENNELPDRIAQLQHELLGHARAVQEWPSVPSGSTADEIRTWQSLKGQAQQTVTDVTIIPDRALCDRPNSAGCQEIYRLESESFTGVVDFYGTRVVQQFPNSIVIWTCNPVLNVESAGNFWDYCQISMVTHGTVQYSTLGIKTR